MSEAINMHKRIAMGGESEANHLKKGGVAKKHHYANGGGVNKGAIPESKAANVPAKGEVRPLPKPGGKIATMKKGGPAKTGIAILLAPMRKSAGRGR
jgi:hypothetical protein